MQQQHTTQDTAGYHPSDLPTSDDAEVYPSPLPPQVAVPERKPRGQLLGGALILAGIIWLGSAMNGPQISFDEQWTDSRVIVIDAGNADIAVTGVQDENVRVMVETQGLLGNSNIDAQQDGDKLTIQTGDSSNFCFFCRQPERYQVEVPVGSEITLRTSSGNIQVTNTAGTITATSFNGDIDMDAVRGNLDTKTTNGNITITSSAVQRLAAETVNGDIGVEGLAGVATISTFNSDIDLNQMTDAVLTLDTINGTIKAEGSLAPGLHRINSLNGDIELRLPENSGLTVTTSSRLGDVSIENFAGLPDPIETAGVVTVGDGRVQLEIMTTSGDIHIHGE